MADVGETPPSPAVNTPQNQHLPKGTSSSDCTAIKISHKRSRALRNKDRRKRKRQLEAKANEHLVEETAPNTDPLICQQQQKYEEQQEKYEEECRERQRQLQHALWLERERLALEQIAEKKRADEESRRRKEAEEKRIREEWEERLRKEKLEEDEINRKIKEKKDKQDSLLKEATSGERKKDDASWHNPLAPANYGKGVDNCQFFMKTGCCRFGDRCSRSHPYPDSGCTLLFRGLYSHFALLEGHQEEFDLDITLEYEEKETYHHFREFYMDVLPEFKEIGKVVQFKVCCNYEPHLRGNVYVQYENEDDARDAFVKFNGRWYAGRQLQCEFSVVSKWKQALCGQYRSKKCPKGKNCNFLHTFRNPGSEFWEADRDFDDRDARSERHQNWQDSERSHRSWLAKRGERRTTTWDRARSSQRRSRSRSPARHRRSTRRSRSRSHSPDDRSSRSNRRQTSHRRRRSRSRSRSRKRSRSRSPERRRPRSKSPSRSRRKSHSPPPSKKRSKSKSPIGSVRRSRSRSRSRERTDVRGKDRLSSQPVSFRWESESESGSSVEESDSISSASRPGAVNGTPSSPSNRSSSRKKSKNSKKHKKQKKHKRKKEKHGFQSPASPSNGHHLKQSDQVQTDTASHSPKLPTNSGSEIPEQC